MESGMVSISRPSGRERIETKVSAAEWLDKWGISRPSGRERIETVSGQIDGLCWMCISRPSGRERIETLIAPSLYRPPKWYLPAFGSGAD